MQGVRDRCTGARLCSASKSGRYGPAACADFLLLQRTLRSGGGGVYDFLGFDLRMKPPTPCPCAELSLFSRWWCCAASSACLRASSHWLRV